VPPVLNIWYEKRFDLPVSTFCHSLQERHCCPRIWGKKMGYYVEDKNDVSEQQMCTVF
jgi:hypothetical protein